MYIINNLFLICFLSEIKVFILINIKTEKTWVWFKFLLKHVNCFINNIYLQKLFHGSGPQIPQLFKPFDESDW